MNPAGWDGDADRFQLVPLDLIKTRQRWRRDPDFAAADDALADEFATLAALIHDRQQARLTQVDAAARMGIAQATVDRARGAKGTK